MNRSYKVDAIVLSRKNTGEADKILTLFTRQFGKKKVIAKGIRKISSRRAPFLEVFSEISAVLHQGRNFDIVTEVSSLSSLPVLQKKLGRISYAYLAVELVDRLTAENQENYLIFQKLSGFLKLLNHPDADINSVRKELVIFKQFLLSELGFIEKNISYREKELDDLLVKILEGNLKSTVLLAKL